MDPPYALINTISLVKPALRFLRYFFLQRNLVLTYTCMYMVMLKKKCDRCPQSDIWVFSYMVSLYISQYIFYTP